MNFKTPVEQLNKVGKTIARRLKNLGVYRAGDLLYYFPFRYEDYSRIFQIKDLSPDEMVTVRVKIELIASKRSFRRKLNITEALVSDCTGSLKVVWFNQPYIAKTLKSGDEVFLSGKTKADVIGVHLANPSYEKTTRTETTHTARLVPIYPLTAGLTQKQLRFLTSQVVVLSKEIEEWLPEEIMEKFDLAPLDHALHDIHFPADENNLKQCTERLKFDELFLLQLKAELARENLIKEHAPILFFQEEKIKKFVASLPFVLTKTQKVAAWEILQDLAKNIPMNRLLSGDVGSGKTVVAAISLYNTVLNGYQGAIIAPTEILATQHYLSLKKMLGDQIKIALRTNTNWQIDGHEYKNDSKARQKKEFLEKLKKGDIDIVVGTHALLTDQVGFKNLGLVVVDEQHRFGVEQRKTLKEKGQGTHFLSMTATPIPRSLALMVYGDLDISIINELPPGRKPIKTRLVDGINRQLAYNFIQEQIKGGRQAFVICPLIELAEADGESSLISADEKKTVMGEYKKLSEKIFPDLKIGYLHGKMKGNEKDQIMENFKNKKIDILISTSVIEVGVDVPNASVMMIEGADRFGLAQLHQFRGRVGRSDYQSYCFLFTDSRSKKAEERLKFFEKNLDGFKLAEKDLEIRGPGEVYGTTQSGLMNLRLAKLTDKDIIKKSREAAKFVVNKLSTFPKILDKIKIWDKGVHLE